MMPDGGGPVFIDQFGTGRHGGNNGHGLGPDDGNEPTWRRCLMGREPLWKMFWFYFVCGHGVVYGIGFGVVVVFMILGFAADPGSLNSGLAGLTTGMVALGAVGLGFGTWCGIGLWRCAYNVEDRRWGHAARVLAISYALIIIVPPVRYGLLG